jgi:ABC-type transport system substrate-binding protein
MRSIRAKIELLSALSLAGCQDNLAAPLPAQHAEGEPPRRGGTLHLATFGDIRSLDAATIADQLGAMAGELLYAGLVDTDAHGNVIPDAASHWDLSPDGTLITFYLRQGVTFHDGEELTADDVKRSVERALNPDTPSSFSSFYAQLAGYEDFTAKKSDHLSGVTVAGRYVVKFQLKEKDSTFLAALALPALRPVCRSAGARYADTWAPCGAGPFKLSPGGWDRGRSLTVVRHESYFQSGLPHLDAVNFTYGMNAMTQRFKFEAGDLDVLRDVTESDAGRFTHDARWQPLTSLEPAVAAYGESMNTEMPPFDNVEVRRAVSAAIDRRHYQLIKRTNVVPSGYLIPPDVPGYNPREPGQTYDLAAALEHMRKAGYPYDPATGRGGYEPHIEYIAVRTGYMEYSAQVLKQDLARIGIRIDIKSVNYATYLTVTTRRGRSAFSPQSWLQDYPDALDFYEPLFSSKAIAAEGSSNTSFYKNPVFDGVLEEARREFDPPKRQKLFDRASGILRDDAPWAFTHSYRWLDVRQPYVKNLETHPLWVFQVSKMWLDRAADVVAFGNFRPSRGKRR